MIELLTPLCGIVQAVRGAAPGPDGLWRGIKADVRYDALLNTPGGVRLFEAVVPDNPRVPWVAASESIICHQPGSMVLGAFVGNRLQIRFDEWPDVEACDA